MREEGRAEGSFPVLEGRSVIFRGKEMESVFDKSLSSSLTILELKMEGLTDGLDVLVRVEVTVRFGDVADSDAPLTLTPPTPPSALPDRNGLGDTPPGPPVPPAPPAPPPPVMNGLANGSSSTAIAVNPVNRAVL